MSTYTCTNENNQQNRAIKLSRISTPSPKSRKYLYTKIMAYTVMHISHRPQPDLYLGLVFNELKGFKYSNMQFAPFIVYKPLRVQN